MARSRNIKPGFFQNDMLAEVEPLGRLLFAGLWTIADRAGRLENRLKRIKAAVLPYDDADVDQLLNQLEKRGFVMRYSVGDKAFIEITNFSKHQNPHGKEAVSTIPAPDKHHTGTAQAPDKNGVDPADSLNPIPNSGFPITDSSPSAHKRGGAYTEEFEQAWSAYPSRPGANKGDAFKAWQARIKEGIDPQSMIAGTLRYGAYCKHRVSSPEYIKQPATFFGTGKHFDSDWTVTASSQPKLTQHQANQAAIAESLFGSSAPAISQQAERVIEGEVVQ